LKFLLNGAFSQGDEQSSGSAARHVRGARAIREARRQFRWRPFVCLPTHAAIADVQRAREKLSFTGILQMHQQRVLFPCTGGNTKFRSRRLATDRRGPLTQKARSAPRSFLCQSRRATSALIPPGTVPRICSGALKEKHICSARSHRSPPDRNGSGAKICWKPVVNVGSRDRGVPGRDGQLMEIAHYISYRINASNRGLLMGIHLQGANFCALGS
jgi:hypothetical protein